MSAGTLTLSGDNSYTGPVDVFDASKLTITSNNALGDPGSNTAGYSQVNGAVNGTALQLSNNIISPENVIYLGLPRDTNAEDTGPQIINLSGSNELTGALVSDSAPSGLFVNYTLQSNAGSNLKLSGSIRQDIPGASTLTLRGAGDGEVSGTIIEPTTTTYN